jgi:hypothetical protein
MPFSVKKPRCPRISLGRERLCPEGGILPRVGPAIRTLACGIYFNVFEACRYLLQIAVKNYENGIKFQQKKAKSRKKHEKNLSVEYMFVY